MIRTRILPQPPAVTSRSIQKWVNLTELYDFNEYKQERVKHVEKGEW